MFRRITPRQLRENSGDEPLAYLKKQAVLLFQKAFEDTDVNLAYFNVSLTYKDMDGDYMIIHNPEDLTAALKEYAEAGKIKIFAQVQGKPSAPSKNIVDSSPSVHTSTQTIHTKTDQETLNVTDAVEHVVGAIASATIIAANQVTRSLRDIKRAERKIIQPIRVATVMRGSCKPNASKTTASSPSVDHKEEKVEVKVSSDEVSPQPVEKEKALSPSVNVESEKNTAEDEASERKPDLTLQEDCAIPAKTSEEPLFIHGRHTCDGCLSTPIVGKRFHAIPDYDLCETCFKNYNGDRDFAEVELGMFTIAFPFVDVQGVADVSNMFRFCSDQDRLFQDRWKTRWDQFRRKGCALVCKALPKSPPHTRPTCLFPPRCASNDVEHDLALEEAVRRSLDDLKEEPVEVKVKPSEFTLAEALRRSDEEAEAEEAAAVEKAIQMSMEEVNKSVYSVVASNTPISARSVASKSSFAQDAAGCGDIANDLGEALDKIANEIDEMTLTLGRPDEEMEVDDVDSYMDEESLKAIETSLDGEKGATIIEGSEPALTREVIDSGSRNSWHMVDSDDDGVVVDANAALGRAAQMIGSALFNSDMERSAPAAPFESVASVSSVPTTVHLDRTEPNTLVPDQLERWALQLTQLHELGFLNDQANVETIERLAAANIGVNSTDEVSVQQVIDEMMKDW